MTKRSSARRWPLHGGPSAGGVWARAGRGSEWAGRLRRETPVEDASALLFRSVVLKVDVERLGDLIVLSYAFHRSCKLSNGVRLPESIHFS